MADESGTLAGDPDEYERRYMDGDAAIVRARQRQPWWLPVSLLTSMGVAIAVAWPALAALWERRDEPGVMTILTFFGAWYAISTSALLLTLVTDHVTRVALTATHLRVHQGLRAQDIALDAIDAVAVERWRWLTSGPSLGRALLRRDRSFIAPGAKHVLRVDWRDARGRSCTTWVDFDAAPVVARHLVERTGGATKVRVADEAAPDRAGAELERALERDDEGRARR